MNSFVSKNLVLRYVSKNIALGFKEQLLSNILANLAKHLCLVALFAFFLTSTTKLVLGQELPTIKSDVTKIESLKAGDKAQINITFSSKKTENLTLKVNTNPPGAIKIKEVSEKETSASYEIEPVGQAFNRGIIFIWLEDINKKEISNILTIMVGSDVTFTHSVMGFKEVADALGKRVANTYIVVQVTVNNNNKDFEYLLRDIEILYSNTLPSNPNPNTSSSSPSAPSTTGDSKPNTASPSPSTPSTKSFSPSNPVSSRDLAVLRQVTKKGQVFSKRNFIIRTIKAIGTVAGGLAPFEFYGMFSEAVGVYNGPFISAVEFAAPDLTIEHLTVLSDKAFQNNQIVSKSSGKNFYVFIPIGIFELNSELWNAYKNRSFKRTSYVGIDRILQDNIQIVADGSFIQEVPIQNSVADFSLTISPQSSTLISGQSINTNISVQPIGTFNKLVSLTVEVTPEDDKKPQVSLGTNPINVGGLFPITITTPENEEGDKTYKIIFKGKADTLERAVEMVLQVKKKEKKQATTTSTTPSVDEDFSIELFGSVPSSIELGKKVKVVVKVIDEKPSDINIIPKVLDNDMRVNFLEEQSSAMLKAFEIKAVNNATPGKKRIIFIPKKGAKEKDPIEVEINVIKMN